MRSVGWATLEELTRALRLGIGAMPTRPRPTPSAPDHNLLVAARPQPEQASPTSGGTTATPFGEAYTTADSVQVALINERATTMVARIQAARDMAVARINAQATRGAERTKFWAYFLTGVIVAFLTGFFAMYRLR